MLDKEVIPFTRPTLSVKEIEAVTACLQSGWLASGPRVEQFEQALAAYFQAPFVVALSSATAGLQLVCQELLRPGDEVITTPLTFVATANSIALAGAKPVFVDINPKDFNLDVALVEAAITAKTKAIMPVHFAGLPVDLRPLYDLAEKYQLRVIEDCAHAIGSYYEQQLLGSFGDIQVFSFHTNKNLTTGEGGAVVCRDEALQEALRRLRFHGIDRTHAAKTVNQLYDVPEPGLKANMMDLQAAIGLVQLPQLSSFNERRTVLAERYRDQMSQLEEWYLPQLPSYDFTHSWHMFNPVLRPEQTDWTRQSFIQAMQDQQIGVGVHYEPVHLYSYYQQTFGYCKGDFPEAERVGANIVTLPLFPTMTFSQQDKVTQALIQITRAMRHTKLIQGEGNNV